MASKDVRSRRLSPEPNLLPNQFSKLGGIASHMLPS